MIENIIQVHVPIVLDSLDAVCTQYVVNRNGEKFINKFNHQDDIYIT